MYRRHSFFGGIDLVWFFVLYILFHLNLCHGELGAPYTLINRMQTECEAQAVIIGSTLADNYNSYDEDTEWDIRLHNEFLVEHLGFAGWIQMGTWKSGGKTPTGMHAPSLHRKGGWAGHKHVVNSSFWALENQWVYMMGDSTVRQIWATFVSPFQNNEFERNAKEWTRERCERQFPKRKAHPGGGHFPDEGWGGNCGNNEVTCHLTGFGQNGKITFDWKHFTYEDYDQWVFGDEGPWGERNAYNRSPDVLTFQFGLHTCFPGIHNDSMVHKHLEEIPLYMAAVRKAVDRRRGVGHHTTVIMVTSGRLGGPDHESDLCIRRFNRVAARAAHDQGFAVLEREEIERRLMFKSEYYDKVASMKLKLHLDNPAPQIVATSLLGLISCLAQNRTDFSKEDPNPFHIFNTTKLLNGGR